MDLPKLPYNCPIVGKNQYVVSKFPSFWRLDPEIWLVQVEAFFTINNITDESKFTVLVANVGDSVLPYIGDIIHISLRNPGNNSDMYKMVKERILKVFGKDEKTRLRELIRNNIHVVERPSQLLQAMIATSCGRPNLELIKSLFIGIVNAKFSHQLSEKNSIPSIGDSADRLAAYHGKWTIRGFWKDLKDQ